MFKTIATVLALSIAPVAATAATAQEACTIFGNSAELVMKARQQGVPLSKLMEISQGNSIVTGIVLEAYKISRYSSPDYQERAIKDFRNVVELACYSEFGEPT